MTLPWYEYRPVVTEFIEGLHERNLNVVFDWGKWKRGEKLFSNPSLIARAYVCGRTDLVMVSSGSA